MRIWASGLVVLIVLVAAKSGPSNLQAWGWPYWFVDYGDGFIRRALAGQVFHILFGRQPAALVQPVMALCNGCLMLIALTVGIIAGKNVSRLRGDDRLGFLAVAVWFVFSELWPTLRYDGGYLDELLLVLALSAALLVRARRALAAGCVLAIGPLVHEYFVFLLPFVLAAGLGRKGSPEKNGAGGAEQVGLSPKAVLALTLVCAGSTALVTFAADPTAAATQIAKMPLPADERHVLATLTFSQSVGQAMSNMLFQWSLNPRYDLFNIAFFLAPAMATSLGIVFWRSRPTWTTLFQAIAGLFPILALLVAWDFSRLLVMANFTSGMIFLFVAEGRSARRFASAKSRQSVVVRYAGFFDSTGLAMQIKLPLQRAFASGSAPAAAPKARPALQY